MEFMSEQKIAASRKEHRCEACCQMIALGQPYVRWSGKVDGDFSSVAYHPECRAAEIALNQNYDTNADEWVSLAYDREGDDDDWLRAEWPLVAERLGIAHPTGGVALGEEGKG